MLVATPQMRKRTGLVYFSWLVVAMVYYGECLGYICICSVFFSSYLYLYLDSWLVVAMVYYGEMVINVLDIFVFVF